MSLYSHRKFNIADNSRWLILYLFCYGLLYIHIQKYMYIYMCEICNIMCYALNINFQIPSIFSEISLQVWAAILERKRLFCSNLLFPIVFGRTLIPECVYRIFLQFSGTYLLQHSWNPGYWQLSQASLGKSRQVG